MIPYAPYHLLDGRPNLVVDGSPTGGTALTVTHWPGFPPPDEIADDLSAQMAFRLIERRELIPGEVEAVTNNHFDQDGLVSIFAVSDPGAAIERRSFLEGVAAAGDFGTYELRDAARVSMVISAYAAGAVDGFELPDDEHERTAVLYTELLARLPELCDHTDRYRSVWEQEDADLDASEAFVAAGGVSVIEFPAVDLAFVHVGEGAPSNGGHRFGGDWWSGLHPMAMHALTDRLVIASLAGRRFEVELRYESWVQLQSRSFRRRRDLVSLANRLQDEERGDARWTATSVGSLIPRLSSGGETSIRIDRILDLLVAHLSTAPPAWDPFAART